jgi:SAM-dependent methyltransferase
MDVLNGSLNFLRKLSKENKRKKKRQKAFKENPHAAAMAALDWNTAGTLQHRAYPSYEAYAEHQKSKLGTKKNMAGYDLEFSEVLSRRLVRLPKAPGGSVLCLGARSGAECAAFIKLGYFAVGIDLNPGEANRYVVVGDFHDLQYADRSVDLVFTNALDHAFDLDAIITEVDRVLKDDGYFIAEIVDPSARRRGDYEAAWWSSIDDVVGVVERAGFLVSARSMFEKPWQGAQVIFGKKRVGAAL